MVYNGNVLDLNLLTTFNASQVQWPARFDQIRTIIDEELEGVWAGSKTAEAALNSAVERGNQLLRRFEQANR